MCEVGFFIVCVSMCFSQANLGTFFIPPKQKREKIAYIVDFSYFQLAKRELFTNFVALKTKLLFY